MNSFKTHDIGKPKLNSPGKRVIPVFPIAQKNTEIIIAQLNSGDFYERTKSY